MAKTVDIVSGWASSARRNFRSELAVLLRALEDEVIQRHEAPHVRRACASESGGVLHPGGTDHRAATEGTTTVEHDFWVDRRSRMSPA